MATVFFNYPPEQIISEEIVGFDSVQVNSSECELFVFVQVTIRHPDAPDDAKLSTIEKRLLKRVNVASSAKIRPAVYLLAHALANLSGLVKNLAALTD